MARPSRPDEPHAAGLFAVSAGIPLGRRRILSILATAGLAAGAIGRTFADPARFGDPPDAGGWGSFTSSFPSQFVQVDDARVLIAGAGVIRRRARIAHRGAVPRRSRVHRPCPGLPLQFRSHDGSGRRRIVDAAALRTPRLTGRLGSVLRHPPGTPGQLDNLRRARSGVLRCGSRSRYFLVRHRITGRRAPLSQSRRRSGRRVDVHFCG